MAGGTGDLAAGLARQVGQSGLVVLTDINAAMLEAGRDRLIDDGLVGNVLCVQANAERLPFADESFDCVTIGFGLRNVTDKARALASMRRVLKPWRTAAGAGVLQARRPDARDCLRRLFLQGAAAARPRRGRRRGQLSLPRRIDPHVIPTRKTLLAMMRAAGLEDCRYHNLMGGIVAVHRGYRCQA